MTPPEPSSWDKVLPLSQAIARPRRRRPDDDVSLFKAMGVGISDLSLGAAIYARARAAGRGRPFAHPKRVPPKIHVARTAAKAGV